MTPQPVTSQDARQVAAHIETVQGVLLERLDAYATCAAGVCPDCDLLRQLAEYVKRITPEHVNTIRALADRLDAFSLGDDSKLY